MTIRVVVADDHPMFRLGLAAVLAQAEDIEVVAEAEAADGHELLAAVAQHSPDVAVTDLTMPGLDGSQPCIGCGTQRRRPGSSR